MIVVSQKQSNVLFVNLFW